jgi:hypothetical protein
LPTSFQIAYGTFCSVVRFVSFALEIGGETVEQRPLRLEVEPAREGRARQWADATAVVQHTVREGLAELVAHLVDRLTGDKDGKLKVFRNSIMTNLNEFLEVFNARNITDDQQLAALVDKARRLISGVDAETLRESKNVRETVRTGFAKIQTALDGMLVDKPERAYRLDDAE